jgi:glycerol-3-phosphate cytidylyltransferase
MSRCDRLIVGVLDDEATVRITGELPAVRMKDRLAIVEAIKYIDEVDVTTPLLLNKVEAWHKYKFDAMFSGDNHLNNAGWTKEEAELNSLGAELVFFPYTMEVDE